MSESNSSDLGHLLTFKILSLLLGGIWLTCLLGLTVTTANPVTLNHQQVLASDFVVQGHFDKEKKSFEVLNSFPIAIPQKKITFVNRDALTFKVNEEYLVPVVAIDGRFHVSPSPLKDLPLIYPATTEAQEQLKRILADKPK